MSKHQPPERFEQLDRKAEHAHQQQIQQLLDNLPHADTIEGRSLRAMLSRVVGRGLESAREPGETWRGKRVR